MVDHQLENLSPLDGRYAPRLVSLTSYFNEAALIHHRLVVEVRYLELLSRYQIIRSFTATELAQILELVSVEPSHQKAVARTVKEIENQTHHDVKAIEYYLRQQLESTSLADVTSFIHFGLTSEDINNIAYRVMMREALTEVIKPALRALLQQLAELSKENCKLPLLARTHGQPALPTTLGKEFVVMATRLHKQLQRLDAIQLTGKCNGAVGNYQAMAFAYPSTDWQEFSKEFVESFGLTFSEVTTQINPPDDYLELFSVLHSTNSILLDCSQDIWRYISDNWLLQKGKEKFVGSSTMPQKVNPIEFENAEGNLTMANGMFEIFLRKLPQSRLQRDLSESTILRNIGSSLGYSLLAYQSLKSGLANITAHTSKINLDLNQNYAILLEAWQTLARKNGDNLAYEKAKKLGQNAQISAQDWQKLTAGLDPTLANLTPETYLGYAAEITLAQYKSITKYLQKGFHGNESS